jgi:hypothetical protein
MVRIMPWHDPTDSQLIGVGPRHVVANTIFLISYKTLFKCKLGGQVMAWPEHNFKRQLKLPCNNPIKQEIDKVIQPVFEISMFFVNE